MATMVSTGSASSGAKPILPLSEEHDKHLIVDNVKKRLDEELTNAIVSSKPARDYWEIVHCNVCTTDFRKGD